MDHGNHRSPRVVRLSSGTVVGWLSVGGLLTQWSVPLFLLSDSCDLPAAVRRQSLRSTKRRAKAVCRRSTAAIGSATPAEPLEVLERDVQLRLFSESGRRGW